MINLSDHAGRLYTREHGCGHLLITLIETISFKATIRYAEFLLPFNLLEGETENEY